MPGAGGRVLEGLVQVAEQVLGDLVHQVAGAAHLLEVFSRGLLSFDGATHARSVDGQGGVQLVRGLDGI